MSMLFRPRAFCELSNNNDPNPVILNIVQSCNVNYPRPLSKMLYCGYKVSKRFTRHRENDVQGVPIKTPKPDILIRKRDFLIL